MIPDHSIPYHHLIRTSHTVPLHNVPFNTVPHTVQDHTMCVFFALDQSLQSSAASKTGVRADAS